MRTFLFQFNILHWDAKLIRIQNIFRINLTPIMGLWQIYRCINLWDTWKKVILAWMQYAFFSVRVCVRVCVGGGEYDFSEFRVGMFEMFARHHYLLAQIPRRVLISRASHDDRSRLGELSNTRRPCGGSMRSRGKGRKGISLSLIRYAAKRIAGSDASSSRGFAKERSFRGLKLSAVIAPTWRDPA